MKHLFLRVGRVIEGLGCAFSSTNQALTRLGAAILFEVVRWGARIRVLPVKQDNDCTWAEKFDKHGWKPKENEWLVLLFMHQFLAYSLDFIGNCWNMFLGKPTVSLGKSQCALTPSTHGTKGRVCMYFLRFWARKCSQALRRKWFPEAPQRPRRSSAGSQLATEVSDECMQIDR